MNETLKDQISQFLHFLGVWCRFLDCKLLLVDYVHFVALFESIDVVIVQLLYIVQPVK